MAAQSHVKSVVAIKRHRTTEWSRLRRRFVHVTVKAPAYAWRAIELFRRSEPFDTDRLRYWAHSVPHGGRCRGGWQCHISGSPGTMPRKECRPEGAGSLGNTHRLRRPASITSLIWLPAVPRAGLKRWPGLGPAPARRVYRRGISSTAMFELSTTIRVEANQETAPR